jgi:hypothetical protein
VHRQAARGRPGGRVAVLVVGPEQPLAAVGASVNIGDERGSIFERCCASFRMADHSGYGQCPSKLRALGEDWQS